MTELYTVEKKNVCILERRVSENLAKLRERGNSWKLLMSEKGKSQKEMKAERQSLKFS